jgi:hypothetical protein
MLLAMAEPHTPNLDGVAIGHHGVARPIPIPIAIGQMPTSGILQGQAKPIMSKGPGTLPHARSVFVPPSSVLTTRSPVSDLGLGSGASKTGYVGLMTLEDGSTGPFPPSTSGTITESEGPSASDIDLPSTLRMPRVPDARHETAFNQPAMLIKLEAAKDDRRSPSRKRKWMDSASDVEIGESGSLTIRSTRPWRNMIADVETVPRPASEPAPIHPQVSLSAPVERGRTLPTMAVKHELAPEEQISVAPSLVKDASNTSVANMGVNVKGEIEEGEIDENVVDAPSVAHGAPSLSHTVTSNGALSESQQVFPELQYAPFSSSSNHDPSLLHHMPTSHLDSSTPHVSIVPRTAPSSPRRAHHVPCPTSIVSAPPIPLDHEANESQGTEGTEEEDESPPDGPIKLSVRHIPLAYENINGKQRCRMCVYARFPLFLCLLTHTSPSP